ncbi:MAG: hypothetical protein KGI84_07535, partial [Elusimicrobia bacterium]|nr:hypothetical protein [Elusimicrobiota bacterium]
MAQIPAPGDKKPRRCAAKDYDHQDVQYWVKAGGMLWWAAAALGLACMYDTLHQSLTFNAWPPYWPLYYLYYPILTAYAGARDKEKRVRRAQQYEKYTGEFFVYGWLAIAILIFFADSLGFGMSWPVNLYETLAVVWGVYLGVKFVVPLKWPIVPYDENNPNDPDAPPQPAPAPGPQPGPNPAPGPN